MKEWPVRYEYTPNEINVKHNPHKNLTIHIKLGIMKNVVKVLDKNGDAFQYLKNVFLNLSDANVNEKSFLGT